MQAKDGTAMSRRAFVFGAAVTGAGAAAVGLPSGYVWGVGWQLTIQFKQK